VVRIGDVLFDSAIATLGSFRLRGLALRKTNEHRPKEEPKARVRFGRKNR
jgi:hypothetical protein